MTLPSERIATDLLTTIDGACNTSPGMVDRVVSAQFGQGCLAYPENLTLWHICMLSREVAFSLSVLVYMKNTRSCQYVEMLRTIVRKSVHGHVWAMCADLCGHGCKYMWTCGRTSKGDSQKPTPLICHNVIYFLSLPTYAVISML